MNYANDPASVQVRYRPAASLRSLPPVPRPQHKGPKAQEARKFYQREYQRCFVRGWTCPDDGKYFNPLKYFAYNYCKVPITHEHSTQPSLEPPLYRVTLDEMLDEIWKSRAEIVLNEDGEIMAKRSARNLCWSKGRRANWTTACLIYFCWLLIAAPGRDLARAYPDETGMDDERDQLRNMYNSLPSAFKIRRTPHGPQRTFFVRDNKKLLRLGYLRPGGGPSGASASLSKKKFEYLNGCHFLIVSQDTGPIRGKELNAIDFVEAGKHTTLRKAFGAVEACLKLGGFWHGHALIGGTSDAISNKTDDYKKFWYKTSTWNARSFFTSAARIEKWNRYTGQPLEADGTAYVLKMRADKEDDPDALRLNIQEYPLSAEEAFIPQGSGTYDEMKLNNQLVWLEKTGYEAEHVVRGRLDWELDVERNRTGRVLFVPDAKGPLLVYDKHLHPRHDLKNAYFAALDDYMKNYAPTSKSKGACVVWFDSTYLAQESDLPVALWYDRPPLNQLYEEIIKLILFFDAELLQEKHNEALTDYFKARGHYKRLVVLNGQTGQSAHENNMLEQTRDAQNFIAEDGLTRMYFSPMVESFKQWQTGINNDIASATHLALARRSQRAQTVVEKAAREVRQAQTQYTDPAAVREKYLGPVSARREAPASNRKAVHVLGPRSGALPSWLNGRRS